MFTEFYRDLEVFLNAGLGIDFIFKAEQGGVYFSFDYLIQYLREDDATNKFKAEWLNVSGVTVELMLVQRELGWQMFFNRNTLHAKLMLQLDQIEEDDIDCKAIDKLRFVSWVDYTAHAYLTFSQNDDYIETGGVYGTQGNQRPIADCEELVPDAISDILDNAPDSPEYALILLKDSRYGQNQYVLTSFSNNTLYSEENTVKKAFCNQHPHLCQRT